MEEVRGTHVGGRNNAHVDYLFVSFERYQTWLPDDIGLFFPNIRGVYWVHSVLTTVWEQDLRQFPNLVTLNLGYNQIGYLFSNTFRSNPNLEIIVFTVNNIHQVEANLMSHLVRLFEAHFHGNPCINAAALDRQAVLALELRLPIDCPPVTCPPLCKEEKVKLRALARKNKERK